VTIKVADDDRRPFFTPKMLAAYLAVGERTVYALLADGSIPSYKIAGTRRIDPDDVDKYLAHQRERRKRGR
jgi:excisionase family DNA binding protein